MSLPQLLVTGGGGQIGGAVARLASEFGFDAVAPCRADLDLTDAGALRRMVDSAPWAAVVNCAAFTAVDLAETEQDLAEAVNARAPAVLAKATANRAIPLVQLSTDYVFDGTKGSPNLETDPVQPLGVYGQTKARGEQAVREGNARHVILRTAWVLSAGDRNFLATMLRLAAERDLVRVVDDQRGNPTSAEDVARAILTILGRPAIPSGTWHCVNAGEATWYDLAEHIFGNLERRGLRRPILESIPTSEYPTPAPRPVDSRLATERLASKLGIVMRPWQDMVDELLDKAISPPGVVNPASAG
ncbi:dTDP-4-dehydrorhamnose reductase [Allopontixanthobacter sp.]|uniref:dTDP-4-dehydrorhamnose reductase n=1 Tax=Allopontixanthobacter sp. TaxID=2906452 RepID=UPI002AB9532D|nr:dTDP-4-dehydrorhamnose reductase [Allopontixanthobacter sp.]MDZ4307428.1 dTDP-4-dehydrorhamnose reductase [Allopontixanthobacter sp.]